MQKYILRRLLIGIPTVLGAALLIFTIMRVMPGDVVSIISIGGTTGEEGKSEEQKQFIREQLGLDKPYPIQFVSWIWDVMRWDLGQSFWTQQPVKELIARRFPLTLQLALMALLLSWTVSIPIGILSAVKQDTVLDYVPRFISIIGLAIPHFWLGILTVTYLAVFFGWVPALTYSPPWKNPLQNFSQLIFPALVLGTGAAAIQVRMMRAQMLEVLREDYIRTARAKGLSNGIVLGRHAMKNALIPVVTIAGGQLSHLISGALVTEVVFNLPGLGAAVVGAVRLRDYPVIQSLVLIITVVHIVVYLAVDILYCYLDPRISYS